MCDIMWAVETEACGLMRSCWTIGLFQRHFSVFALSFPGVEALNTIYCSILSQHLRGEGFPAVLQKSCSQLVQLALAFHQRITATFLPTAIKFHYIFNLRDLSNIFQVLRSHSSRCELWSFSNKPLIPAISVRKWLTCCSVSLFSAGEIFIIWSMSNTRFIQVMSSEFEEKTVRVISL